MDWRAKSKSRSRSRGPTAMDWRAQSRSRSRAPDFRVAVAPPTVDTSFATASFYHHSHSTPATVLEERESPRDPDVESEASGGAGGLDFFASPPPTTSANSTTSFSSYDAPAPQTQPQSFSFPPDVASPLGAGSPAANDPNLAAIENTLNQLISLQLLAATSPPPSIVSSPRPNYVSDFSEAVLGQHERGRTQSTDGSSSLAQHALQQLAVSLL